MAGLFDAFTGQAQRDAGTNNGTWATGVSNAQNQRNFDYTANAENKLQNGLMNGQNQYDQQQTGGLRALQGAYNTGAGNINSGASNALGYLDPYAQAGGQAQQMYSNSLGLNGAAGNAAATGAFQAGPGYEWQVNQATDAAARKANSLGMAASGNTLDAITRLGSQLANQEYGSWQDRLNGQAGMGAQMAGAQSGIANGQGQSLAALGQNFGNQTAAMYGKGATDLSSLSNSNAIANAGLWSNLGNQQNDLTKSLMNIATNSNTQGANAQNAANQNMWGAVTGAANSLMSLFG